MNLDLVDKIVLLNLIESPTISTNAMKKKLEAQGYPVSYHQLTQTLSRLHQSGALRKSKEIFDPVLPGGQRIQTEVEGRYIPKSLGLVRQDVIFYGFPSSDQVTLFSDICDRHPYTHYRTFFLNDGLNAYTQFDVPVESKQVMHDLYSRIAHELGLTGYEVITEERMSQSELDLTRWSFGDNWSVFGRSFLDSNWESLVGSPYYEIQEWTPVIDELDELDLVLIRELTINGKVRPVDVAKYYNRDPSTLSRRFKKLFAKVMAKPVLQYNRQLFDITVPLLVTGSAKGPEEINKLHSLIESSFSFRSYLRSEKKRFIQVVWLPPSIAGEYGYFLWQHFQHVKLSYLYLDMSWVYPFYNLNFDSEHGGWKTNHDYLIDEPLSIS